MVGGYKRTRATVSKNSKKSVKRFRKGSAKKNTRLTKSQYNTVNKMINKKIYNPKFVEYKTFNTSFVKGTYVNGSAVSLIPTNLRQILGAKFDEGNKRLLIKSIQIKGWISIKQKVRNPSYSKAFLSLGTYISKKGPSDGIKDFYTNVDSLDTDADAMFLYYKGIRDKFSYKNYKYIKGLNMRRSIKEVANMGTAEGESYEYSENMFKVNLYKKVNIPNYRNYKINSDEEELNERQNEIYTYIFMSNPEGYEYNWNLDISIKYIDL